MAMNPNLLCRHDADDDEGVAEVELFFDSRDELLSAYDSFPGSPADQKSPSGGHFISWVSGNSSSQALMSNPGSVQERRDMFVTWMGLDLSGRSLINSHGDLKPDDEISPVIEQLMPDGTAIFQSSGSETCSPSSSQSSSQPSTSSDRPSDEDFEYIIKNLDDGRVLIVDEFGDNGSLRSLHEVGSNHKVSFAEFEKSFSSLSFIQRLMHRQDKTSGDSKNSVRRRARWLRRLGIATCIVNMGGEETSSSFSDFYQKSSCRFERVKVRSYKKRSKEMSALYNVQETRAHDGAILTMKFSPDGWYLATGGEDGVVRVWRVMERERAGDFDVPRDDPSCLYLKVNDNSELVHLDVSKEKKAKTGSMKRTSDSACVVLPQSIFRISEEPLHEFRGHVGDVLDLSWSKNKHILSSSVDKTVRLWQVGSDHCLKVFQHTNYVPCVQFSPANDNKFISGSIDGKVRVWEIRGCRVVDWVDVKEIVTAVCYRPDGSGIVVGTISGNCRFYDASVDQLQLESQVSINHKRKSLLKRITGFQYCPSDPKKLMVSSADSKIRILDGFHRVFKYKGPRSGSSLVSASFTPDGQYILSACEDSNIYVWNHVIQSAPASNHATSSWAHERYVSGNPSVAIPWNGTRSINPLHFISSSLSSQSDVFRNRLRFQEKAPDNFNPSQDFVPDFVRKGSATWPEEQLPSNSLGTSAMDKSQYNFLKTSCQNASHGWGQVIVTAGWDGRIRSFQNYGLPVDL